MSEAQRPGGTNWQDAQLAAALCAAAPAILGGVLLRAGPGPVRDSWLELLRDWLPAESPQRRIPVHVSETRLLGGLDLAGTLQAGRPVAERGLLAECHGGVAVLAMAERASRATVAHLAAVLDSGEVLLEREGISGRTVAAAGVVALDEGLADDEAVAAALSDRLALHLDLRPLSIRDLAPAPFDATAIAAARDRLARVTCPEDATEALCGAALALGVDSLRATLLAVQVARAVAALRGSDEVDSEALDAAVRLVLAPRATRLPLPEQAGDEHEVPPEPPSPEQGDGGDAGAGNPAGEEATAPDGAMQERLLEAAMASIPADLLARLQAGAGPRQRNPGQGKSGALQRHRLRGRPMGVAPGDPRSGARLSLVATLRAAAPWQNLRRDPEGRAIAGRARPRVVVRREDFRVTRFRQRSESTTIFVVDASGSAALHRLAEAKGAIELLLADCYVRRDQVALVAFRGEQAELLLPPTRSLVRAKRNLAALPGGGGTPLASAIDMAASLVEQIQRRGGTPAYVMLTDGRANICRDGSQGRQAAGEEALAAAGVLNATAVRGMVIDTSPRPHHSAEQLARALGALYVPLPHADATALRDAVEAGAR
jgi:magnesium chelatase subunit D